VDFLLYIGLHSNLSYVATEI